MSVAGLCEICGSESVEDACDRCGRLVCLDHFDPTSGLCTKCLAEFGKSREEVEERPDGVDEYQF
jgi:hypothetical protein